MFIRSERLFLRPGWPEDSEELLTAINDEAVVKNLARAPWPYTRQDAMEFARSSQQKTLPHFFITLPSSSGPKLIGHAGLDRRDGDVELGYWIARRYWGHGYATEAVRAVLRLASALGLRRITASQFADNPASGRVLVKTGFRLTGERGMRFSKARGGEALALDYAVDLGAPSRCDENADVPDMAMEVA